MYIYIRELGGIFVVGEARGCRPQTPGVFVSALLSAIRKRCACPRVGLGNFQE